MMCNKVPKNGQHPPICMFILMNKVYIDQKVKKTIQNIYDAFKKIHWTLYEEDIMMQRNIFP